MCLLSLIKFHHCLLKILTDGLENSSIPHANTVCVCVCVCVGGGYKYPVFSVRGHSERFFVIVSSKIPCFLK